MTQYITKLEDFNTLIKSDKLVVIDFTATWCGPCKMISPKFQELETKYPNCIFRKVDVDESQEISEQCSISAMPTFHLYKNGIMLALVYL